MSKPERVSTAVKGWLRAVLTAEQYRSLASLKQSQRALDALFLVLQEAIERRAVSPEVLLGLKRRLRWLERMDYGRHEILLHVDSTIEYQTRLHSCAKEADTVEWIETSMQDGDVFYDVGANVGAYSLVAAKFHAGRVRVVSFEPAFENFAQLCRNIHVNGCQDAIVALPLALDRTTALGAFNYHDLMPGGSLHTLGAAVDHRGNAFEPVLRQAVLGFRMDELIERFALPTPTHIKVDVDGIELAVLEGAERTLKSGAVKSLLVEVEEGGNERRISAWLAASGFRLESSHARWTAKMLNCIYVRVS